MRAIEKSEEQQLSSANMPAADVAEETKADVEAVKSVEKSVEDAS